MDLKFYEHHFHTEYSNLRLSDSLNKLTNSIDYAIKLGLSGVTITDHECLSGHIKAIQYRKKLREKGIDFKISLGNEIYLIDESEYKKTNDFYHFLLIAKDKVGHDQLRELSTRAWSRAYVHKKMLRVPTFYKDLKEIISVNKGHLIASTACLGSYFARQVLTLVAFEQVDNPDMIAIKTIKKDISNFLKTMVSIFGEENFFIEIQASQSKDQILYNKRALDIAKHYNIKWLITNDVHYQSEKDKLFHSVFLKSKDGDRETDDFYSYTYFKNTKDIFTNLSHLNALDVKIGVENSILLGDMIEEYDLQQSVKVPEIKLPQFEIQHYFKDFYKEYEFIDFFANSPYDQDRYFFYQIEKGFIEKKEPINKTTLERINTELDVIKSISDTLKQRMSAYFNLVRDIEDVAWDDHFGDSLVGVSRGSVTGFYTCYLMDIHQLNPIKWDLVYWRFLNKSRTDELPDIDLDFQPSRRPAIFEALKQRYGYENGLNIITFKTEKLKSAILTACRGLGIDNAIASDIAASIPIVRGQVLSLKQCLEGDEEEGYLPNTYFINQLKQHNGLLEAIEKIEGIVNGYSIHASGFFIFQDGFIKQNSLMKSPGGQFCTCWDLHDSEYTGGLKFDALVTDAEDKIRKTMDLLIKDGKIKWQGSLWKTYKKYLHPDVLNYDDKKMWEKMSKGEIPQLFQFDTVVGGDAIKKIQPYSLTELAMANSLCRIISDGEIQPIDKYVMFKNNINLWYEEMQKTGLNTSEIEILKVLLLGDYGISAEQESVMQIVMHPKISNFTLKQANGLRKAIAKKKKDLIEENKNLFFQKGKEIGTRQIMLDYVWHYCIEPQLGYSFSRNHTMPYSVIALQEANLFHYYSPIYWLTACLTINASALEEGETEEDGDYYNENIDDISDDEILDEEQENIEESSELLNNLMTKPKKKTSSTNYGKIAKSIGNLQSTTKITMELPDINKAEAEFAPDVENNAIMFGLKGITGINEELVKNIINQRSYQSMIDFYNKIQPTNAQMLSLIKAGCFDNLEKINRTNIMNNYLMLLAKEKINIKDKLTMTDFNKLAEADKVPEELKKVKQMYFFKQWLFMQPNGTSIDNILIKQEEEQGYKFFKKRCVNEYSANTRTITYIETDEGLIVYKKPFETMYKKYMGRNLEGWLNQPETIKFYNDFLIEQYIQDLWEKQCKGSISQWEMESLSYYYHNHELTNVNRTKYGIDNFNSLPEEPTILGIKSSKQGKEYTDYKLSRIMGTVLDRNNTKHMVTLLTTDGVVTVKFYDGLYNFYNKTIKQKVEKKGKITNSIVEKTWFARGNKLIINGIRRGDYFFPKKKYDSDYYSKHCVILINSVDYNGDLDLKLEREKGGE